MPRDLLDESSSESESDVGSIEELKINSDFAQRFEHNKKREELQKLEEKYGKDNRKRKRDDYDDKSPSEDSSSSSSEDEDDAGELATAALDTEIMATLDAIRSRDPRVYDGMTTFYSSLDQEQEAQKKKPEKSMYLRDYHREKLLGKPTEKDEDQPMSYNQTQENLKREIVGAMHAAVAESSDEEDDLLVAKKQIKPVRNGVTLDVENAEKDPEKFLSNFMVSRAWVPTEKAVYQPLESDDEEEERRADEYEEAYNMRFEDPTKSNEKLRTHARDMAAKYSVRRDEKNPRQRRRDEKREQKELERQQHKEEKARFRKLRVEQVEEKVKKIKRAAGLKSKDIQPADWAHFVDEDWDDTQWEEEMQKRFGDTYYAEQDIATSDDESVRKKARKPKFEDDIDINDIVPDFKAEEDDFILSDEEKPSKRNHKKTKEDKTKEAKRERRIIEQLVDDQLQLELNNTISGKSKATGFRYRETSPVSFGLTSRDILLAEDTQLNQFAGLKKLAAFRDQEKKAKDKKHLGKKARLRKWRKDTFGDEEGLQESELVPQPGEAERSEDIEGGLDVRTSGKKKRRRSKKQKSADTVA